MVAEEIPCTECDELARLNSKVPVSGHVVHQCPSGHVTVSPVDEVEDSPPQPAESAIGKKYPFNG